MKDRDVEMSQEWGQNTHFVRISDPIEIFTILVLSMVDHDVLHSDSAEESFTGLCQMSCI